MKAKDAKRRWRPGLLVGIALMLVISALVLAACGGGSSGSSESSSTTSSEAGSSGSGSEGQGGPGGFDVTDEQRSCLKEKGVELPESKGGEGGEPPEGFEPSEGGEAPEGGLQGNSKAFEECGVELGEFAGGEGTANMNSASFRKQVTEYVACVREHGYELGEPNFSGEGPIFEKSDSESAAFKKASSKCEGLLSGQTGGSGSGATEEE